MRDGSGSAKKERKIGALPEGVFGCPAGPRSTSSHRGLLETVDQRIVIDSQGPIAFRDYPPGVLSLHGLFVDVVPDDFGTLNVLISRPGRIGPSVDNQHKE